MCATGRQVLAHGSSSPIPGHRPFSLCGVRLARAGLAGDEGEGLIGEAQGHCSRSVVGGHRAGCPFLGAVIGCSHLRWPPAHGWGCPRATAPALLCPHTLVGKPSPHPQTSSGEWEDLLQSTIARAEFPAKGSNGIVWTHVWLSQLSGSRFGGWE